MDEQPVAPRAASDGDHPAVGHLPRGEGRLLQVSFVRVCCLSHQMEARSYAEK